MALWLRFTYGPAAGIDDLLSGAVVHRLGWDYMLTQARD